MSNLISNKTSWLPLKVVVVKDAAELARIESEDEILPIGTVLQAATEEDEYVVWGVGAPLSESPVLVQAGS